MSSEHWSQSSGPHPHPHASAAPPPHGPHSHVNFSHPHFNNGSSWYHHHTIRGGPRFGGGRGHRLFFFALGAGAATLWIKHKEHHSVGGQQFDESCRGWEGRWRVDPPAPTGAVHSPPATVGDYNTLSARRVEPKAVWDVELEKAKRQASDVAANAAETSLDTVLSTLSALKLQLEEERAQRGDIQSTKAAERTDIDGSGPRLV